MSRDTFLRGALILTVAGIIVKIIGAVNRILLSRLLGGEGIGLYQMAYPIYLLALSVSSAGIPVAISIIVAEKLALSDWRGANKVFRVSLLVLSATGAVFTILLFFGAGWLVQAHFVRDPRAYYSIAALAPAIFFVTVLSSYRGYFQGLQLMTPTAVSQIVEQLFRVITMILLAYVLLPWGIEYAAAGASFGAAPGAAAGLAILMYYYWRQRGVFQQQAQRQVVVRQESAGRIIKRIIKLAVPVSLASIMVPVVANIDLLVVPARLEAAGYTVEQATELYGYLTGMAVTLINLPAILTGSLAASLVPAVSEAYTLGNKPLIYQRTATAMRISNLITMPSFVGLWALATPISQMLYGTPNAGTPIAILSFGVVMLGIHQVTTGVLQGLGHTVIPVRNMIISASIKVVLSWWLTAQPALGIKGASWATVADFGIAALLNMIAVRRLVGFGLHMADTVKAVLSSVVMGGVVLLVYDAIMTRTFHNTVATAAAIATGAVVYGVIQLVVGGIKPDDVARLPYLGPRLARVLRVLPGRKG